ncbi:MAG: acyl-CoA thioesterase [Pseudomonadota bacterium]
MPRVSAHRRARYPWFVAIPTRFADNDAYGHVNNAHYHAFFDTAVSLFLARECGVDFSGPRIDAIVENHCSYLRPIAFPDTVHAGVGLGEVGRSSARFEIGLFANEDDTASAQGWFVQVRCDRASGQPVEIEADWRAVFARHAIREGA